MSLASGGRALRRHPRRTRSLLRQDVGQNHLEHIAHRTRVAHADAPSTFSRMPPTGSTVPASVSSPLMAASPRTGCPVSAETRATASVTPADGPSFHRAASAKCTCTSVRIVEPGGAGEVLCVRAHPRHRDVRRLPRHRPHRPGDAQRPAAGKPRRLDEQHVAALAGCGQAQGDAGTADPGGDLLVAEPRRPEPRGHRFRPHLPRAAEDPRPAGALLCGRARRCRRRGRARPARASSR